MRFTEVFVDRFENRTADFVNVHDNIRIGAGSRIFRSTIKGPLYLNRNSQLGPDIVAGKYTGLNESCYIARGTIGAYCSIGARTAINPFNHPTRWLSTHEFQYHPNSYDWVAEYQDLARLGRSSDMFGKANIGNDVWTGHNVNILADVTIGDGAIIAAGSVVTKDVPPYAIAAGVPAVVKGIRFADSVIERLLKLKWWELELSQLSGLPFRDIERCMDLIENIKQNENSNCSDGR
jgi:acetyltransferase-like isoleucine patch superfamily enzyme